MIFHTDHYFHIGSSHHSAGKPCQDYALSASNKEVACAIVSDGCSTGRHTDVGSRVITLSTLEAIRDYSKASEDYPQDNFGDISSLIYSRQKEIIGASRLILGLERIDTLATCNYVFLTEKGGFFHIQGDGVVAYKYRGGVMVMQRYDWDDNTPFYPSYTDGGIEDFIEAHGGDLSRPRLTVTTVVKDQAGVYSEQVNRLTLGQGLLGDFKEILQDHLKEMEFVAVFSDGVTQIENVDWKEAVTSMFAFKNVGGEFLKRRMMWEIKSLLKVGKGPVDDISGAIVRIENPEPLKEE